jgi:hypothetical protein
VKPTSALSLDDEERVVSRFRDGAHDESALLDALFEAMDGGRLRLAVRLVGLLEQDHEDVMVQRARRAATMMVHNGLDAADVSWSECDEALRALRVRRMERAKRRIRDRVTGDRPGRVGRLDRGDRRR